MWKLPEENRIKLLAFFLFFFMNNKFLIIFVAVFLTACGSSQENEDHDHIMLTKSYTIPELKEKLKDKKFEINAIYKNNKNAHCTLLTRAASENNFELVKFLVENGANADGNRYGTESNAPIFFTDDLQIVEFLLQHGADVSAQDGMASVTPLHLAAERGDLEMTKLLLKYGANVNTSISNGNLSTPLHCACENTNNKEFHRTDGSISNRIPQYFEVIKLLIQYGAEANKPNRYGELPAEMLKRSGDRKSLLFLQRYMKNRHIQ